MILWCAAIVLLMVAVVEINRWAHDVGSVTQENELPWSQMIAFILGTMFGVLVSTIIVAL